MSRVRAGILLCLIAIAVPGVAGAQTNYGGGGLTLSATSVLPGQTITASGSGYGSGSSVSLTFTSDPVLLATAVAGSGGTFSVGVTIPANATVGAHTITAAGVAADGSARIATASVTVGSSSGGLVRTGDNSGNLARWAAVLVAVGSILVVSVSMRRRWKSTQTVQ